MYTVAVSSGGQNTRLGPLVPLLLKRGSYSLQTHTVLMRLKGEMQVQVEGTGCISNVVAASGATKGF